MADNQEQTQKKKRSKLLLVLLIAGTILAALLVSPFLFYGIMIISRAEWVSDYIKAVYTESCLKHEKECKDPMPFFDKVMSIIKTFGPYIKVITNPNAITPIQEYITKYKQISEMNGTAAPVKPVTAMMGGAAKKIDDLARLFQEARLAHRRKQGKETISIVSRKEGDAIMEILHMKRK